MEADSFEVDESAWETRTLEQIKLDLPLTVKLALVIKHCSTARCRKFIPVPRFFRKLALLVIFICDSLRKLSAVN